MKIRHYMLMLGVAAAFTSTHALELFKEDCENTTLNAWGHTIEKTGTNPADSNSVFAISGLDPIAAPTRVQWMRVSGRTYFVECSLDLASWHVLPGAESVLASGAETGVVDTNKTINIRFYRVGVIPE